jgi:ferric-dicitrate binding protein FerR (iron transport regulator)
VKTWEKTKNRNMSTSELLKAPKEFLNLYKAGKNAAQQGQKAIAHDLLRQAIEIDPYHEQVWLWLATVVDTDEDRRVCFENVLELNPDNATAQEQLNLLERKALAITMQPELLRRNTEDRAKRRRRAIRVTILLVLLLAVVAVGSVLIFF